MAKKTTGFSSPPTAVTPEKFNSLREGAGGRAVHDVGGLDFGPIDRAEHDLALWEKRTDAMAILLVSPRKAAFKLDAKRRVVESFVERQYDGTEYYERWIRAIRNLLVEQEIATPAEFDAKAADVAKRMKASGRGVKAGSVPWDDPTGAERASKAASARKPAKGGNRS